MLNRSTLSLLLILTGSAHASINSEQLFTGGLALGAMSLVAYSAMKGNGSQTSDSIKPSLDTIVESANKNIQPEPLSTSKSVADPVVAIESNHDVEVNAGKSTSNKRKRDTNESSSNKRNCANKDVINDVINEAAVMNALPMLPSTTSELCIAPKVSDSAPITTNPLTLTKSQVSVSPKPAPRDLQPTGMMFEVCCNEYCCLYVKNRGACNFPLLFRKKEGVVSGEGHVRGVQGSTDLECRSLHAFHEALALNNDNMSARRSVGQDIRVNGEHKLVYKFDVSSINDGAALEAVKVMLGLRHGEGVGFHGSVFVAVEGNAGYIVFGK